MVLPKLQEMTVIITAIKILRIVQQYHIRKNLFLYNTPGTILHYTPSIFSMMIAG